MSNLKIVIDAKQIAAAFNEVKEELEKELTQGVKNLAAVTHAKVAEMASTELKSSLKKFQDSLGFEEVSENVWVVSIDEKGLFIEDGIPTDTDMKPGLLKGATKVSAEGYKYRSIPFDHTKSPSQSNGKAQDIVNELKLNLKKANIPFKGIEKNADGSPRIGKLHSLHFGGGKPTSAARGPTLNGVSIYQSMVKGSNEVKRNILTFRTVSDNPDQDDLWIHPGLKPKDFLGRAEKWSLEIWEQQILPSILKKYEK